MDDKDVIHHNRWSEAFRNPGFTLHDHSTGEQFKKLIADYKTERITGIRLAGKDNIKTMEFQVNGIWRGHIGKQSDDWNELVLNDDEYFNQIIINDYLYYIKFVTNKEN
eukprot:447788_1